MNVVTGVFCENAIRTAQHDQEEVINQQLAEKRFYTNQLRQLFEAIDENCTGTITIQEFEAYMENPRVLAYLQSLEINTQDMWSFFQLLDTDGTMTIELEEFVEGILKLKGPAKSIDVALVLHKHKKASGSLADYEKAMKKGQKQFISKLESILSQFLLSEEHVIRSLQQEMVQLKENVFTETRLDPINREMRLEPINRETSALRLPLTTVRTQTCLMVRTPRSPRSFTPRD